MTEMTMRCVVRTAAGERTVTGSFRLAPGANRIRAELPEGTLVSVTASGPWEMTAADRVFMNGYQSWTCSPERAPDDRIDPPRMPLPGVVAAYGMDRYGDYHFVPYPRRKGHLHGISWCSFRRGDRVRLLASLDEEPGYTLFASDFSARTLSLTRDCAGVRCGGSFAAFSLYYAEGTEEQVYDGWFAGLGIVPRTREPLAGYSSWYNRYEKISQETILSDLAGCGRILQPGDLFQIDDGWEPKVGDWLEADPVKFPDGIASAAEAVHAAGFRAGLWLAPFAAAEGSALLRAHPDWVLRHDGKPWRCGGNWGGFYGLDIDNPAVESYIRQVFRRVFDEWHIDLVKLDFLYAAAPFGTEAESRAGRMLRAMRLLRDCCGEHLMLVCGVPLMPAFGLADYCRIGSDVGLDWDDVFYMRRAHRERVSTRNSLTNTVTRRCLNGRAWLNDPDVFFLRDDNLRLTPEQKRMLAEADALLGGVFLTSDDPASYTDAQTAEYRRLRALRGSQLLRVASDPARTLLRYRTPDGAEAELVISRNGRDPEKA